MAQTATALAGVASYPFDTVRRRLMMQVPAVSAKHSWKTPLLSACSLHQHPMQPFTGHTGLAEQPCRVVLPFSVSVVPRLSKACGAPLQSGREKQYDGTVDAWKQIYQKEGTKAFFRVRNRCCKTRFTS